jgi:hypothetical protein
MGLVTPFSSKGDQADGRPDFYGTLAFEVDYTDIGGFECNNSLIELFSRAVFEAKSVRKKVFASLKDFFHFYNLDEVSHTHYRPTFNGQKGTIEVKTSNETMNEVDQAYMRTRLNFDITLVNSHEQGQRSPSIDV